MAESCDPPHPSCLSCSCTLQGARPVSLPWRAGKTTQPGKDQAPGTGLVTSSSRGQRRGTSTGPGADSLLTLRSAPPLRDRVEGVGGLGLCSEAQNSNAGRARQLRGGAPRPLSVPVTSGSEPALSWTLGTSEEQALGKEWGTGWGLQEIAPWTLFSPHHRLPSPSECPTEALPLMGPG